MAIKQSVKSTAKTTGARRGRPPQNKSAKVAKTTKSVGRPPAAKAVKTAISASSNNSVSFDLQSQLEIQQKAIETQLLMTQEISQLRQQLSAGGSGDSSALLAEIAQLRKENKELREKSARPDKSSSTVTVTSPVDAPAPKRRGRIPNAEKAAAAAAQAAAVAPKRRGRIPNAEKAAAAAAQAAAVAPKRRGRIPNAEKAAAAAAKAAAVAPKRRGRIPNAEKAAAAAAKAAAVAPKRRGRIPNAEKAAAAAAKAAAVAPKRRGRIPNAEKAAAAAAAMKATAKVPAKRGRKPKAVVAAAPIAAAPAARKNAKGSKSSLWQAAASSDIKRTYKSCWPVVFKIEEWNQKNPNKLAKISQTMLNKSGVNFSRAKGFIETYANVVQDYHDQIGLNKANSGKFNEVYEFIRSSLGKGRKL
jgi:hypothetical protein